MKLYELLEGIAFTGKVENNAVTLPVRDSRQVEKDSLFFCIPGGAADGHDYAAQALEKGAAAVVVQRDLGLDRQLLVEDTHEAYGIACANYFGNPSKKLRLLGVTGTNGKTTVAFLTKYILEHAGHTVGLIGTVQNELPGMVLPARHTTPDPFQLHSLFARMVEAGCDYAVMEVSSHALDQRRVAGCHFAASAFTNLTEDHLDYHHEMEAYFQAKKRLFDQSAVAVLNLDDRYGRRLSEELTLPQISFSCERHQADITAHNIKFSQRGSHFALLFQGKLSRVDFVQPGYFSVSNAMAAAGLCMGAGLGFQALIDGLEHCKGVPGRFEILETDTPYTVIRDYAHSPDGLEKLLSTVREFAPGRIVTLFGCAGVRDRKKRPHMAKIVAEYSDFCILTSDNPRTEDPQQIIDDALPGFTKKTKHKEFVDRYEAIRWALDNSLPGDTLLLAGKGHEDYQVLDFGTICFDEKEIVRELLAEKQKESS